MKILIVIACFLVGQLSADSAMDLRLQEQIDAIHLRITHFDEPGQTERFDLFIKQSGYTRTQIIDALIKNLENHYKMRGRHSLTCIAACLNRLAEMRADKAVTLVRTLTRDSNDFIRRIGIRAYVRLEARDLDAFLSGLLESANKGSIDDRKEFYLNVGVLLDPKFAEDQGLVVKHSIDEKNDLRALLVSALAREKHSYNREIIMSVLKQFRERDQKGSPAK
jgi:hypothetical protein